MSAQRETTELIAETLFPKAAANHVSKLPGFESSDYGSIIQLAEVSQDPEAIADYVAGFSDSCDPVAIRDELVDLGHMLRDREDLCRLGKKATVFARTDAQQRADGHSSRSLEYFEREGVLVEYSGRSSQKVDTRLTDDDRDVPFAEKLKTERIFAINGFADSRVMYLAHDILDHVWLFGQFRDIKLFERYQDYLTSIDVNPDMFLYSRQSELFSTVGFGSRRWPLIEQEGEAVLLSTDHVDRILGDSSDYRAQEARALLANMSKENQSHACFVIENMAIQIADERRRWGSVKKADNSPMPLLDPVYVALLIEGIDYLQQNPEIFKEAQVNVVCYIEALLIRLISGEGDFATRIPREEVVSDGSRRSLSEASLSWLAARPFFITSYVQTNT